MTQPKNDGGPAFPNGFDPDYAVANRIDVGMSLRDYFLAHAPITFSEAHKLLCLMAQEKGAVSPTAADIIEYLAFLRFQYADAMLKARGE